MKVLHCQQNLISILCSMALLWQSFISIPAFAEIPGATSAKQNFMNAFSSQMSVENPNAEDFSYMLNAAKNVQDKLAGQEKTDFTEKILNPLNAFNNANKTIDNCSCPDGDCSMKKLNLNFDFFQSNDEGQCQRQKAVIDDDFKTFLNSFNAVNLKLTMPADFKKGGDSQAKQKNLKEFRDLLVGQTQEDLLLPYIKLSRNFRDGQFPGKTKDVLSKLKISLIKENPTSARMQQILDEPIQNDLENNTATKRREKLFIGFQNELKSIDKIYTEEADYAEAINQIDRVAPSIWTKDKSWTAPSGTRSELAQKRDEVKSLFPTLTLDPKATTVDEVVAPTFQLETFNVETQEQFHEKPTTIKLNVDRVNYQAVAPKKPRVDESVIPEYLNIKYGILARGQSKFNGNEETRAQKEKMLATDLKKYFVANLLPQKSDLTNEEKNQMAESFLSNLDQNIESSFEGMRANNAGITYSLTGGAPIDYDNNHPYIKSQKVKANEPKLRLLGENNKQTNNSRKFEATLDYNRGLTQDQIIGAGIRSAIENVPTPSGGGLDQFLQKKVSANFHARQEIAQNLKANPVFYGGQKGLASKLYRGDPDAKKEDMQEALDDYFSKTEVLLGELEKNYDNEDPEDQIASILKRNPALVARVLSKNPQYANMVCDLKKKFLKDQKSSEMWDKIFFGAGMVLMGAAVLLTAGAALGVFVVAGAVTAGFGAAGFALGAVGTTRTTMNSAELFEESRQANAYLVSMGVGNKDEVEKLLDEANRKMRDAFIEGGMTLAGGTGIGLTGKLFRYAKARGPAAVKSMLQEAGASREGAKKVALVLEEEAKVIPKAEAFVPAADKNLQTREIFNDSKAHPFNNKRDGTYTASTLPSEIKETKPGQVEIFAFDGRTRDLQSYHFKAADGTSAYRVGTGEQIKVVINPGEKVALGSTDFYSCAGAAVSGVGKDGKRVLMLSHFEEDHAIGQFQRLQSEIAKLKQDGVRDIKIFVSLDERAMAAAPSSGSEMNPSFYNSFPKTLKEAEGQLGSDVKVLDLKSAKKNADGTPSRRSLYATEEGIVIEYPGAGNENYSW